MSASTLAKWRDVADTERVPSDGQPDSRELSAVAVARIAEAFELPRDAVRADAALVIEWLSGERTLRDHLGNVHEWDSSVAPYYLVWLRGHAQELPK